MGHSQFAFALQALKAVVIAECADVELHDQAVVPAHATGRRLDYLGERWQNTYSTSEALPAMAWITTKQAAELSGYNRDWVRRLTLAGKFKAEKVEGRWQIDREDFLRFVEEQKEDRNSRAGPREKSPFFAQIPTIYSRYLWA